jgi:hypothetical protein
VHLRTIDVTWHLYINCCSIAPVLNIGMASPLSCRLRSDEVCGLPSVLAALGLRDEPALKAVLLYTKASTVKYNQAQSQSVGYSGVCRAVCASAATGALIAAAIATAAATMVASPQSLYCCKQSWRVRMAKSSVCHALWAALGRGRGRPATRTQTPCAALLCLQNFPQRIRYANVCEVLAGCARLKFRVPASVQQVSAPVPPHVPAKTCAGKAQPFSSICCQSSGHVFWGRCTVMVCNSALYLQ